MSHFLGHTWNLVKQTLHRWVTDGVAEMSAAMAFYAAFSLAPTVLILMWLVGSIYGEEGPLQIQEGIADYVGPEPALFIAEVITSTRDQIGTGIGATIFTLGTMLLGASWAFTQLLSALNRVWHVAPRPGRGLVGILRDRFWSFLTFGIGSVLVLVSLILSTFIHATGAYVDSLVPGTEFLWQYVDLGLSVALLTVLFALLFKFLPDARVAWSDVWIGALVTSALFSLGKYGFSLYLSTTGRMSVYGAAGSLLLVLIWAYFSTSILLLGAEFTHIYAELHGHSVVPKKNAVRIN